MATDFSIHHQHDHDSIHPFHKAGNFQQSQEAEIEARIQQLDDRIGNLDLDSRLVWLKTGPHVYSPELDFSVKVEAVRWMLRIAKHLQDSAREVVFLRIENSLRQLERSLHANDWSTIT
ncbi:MAG: hypothetical protein WCC21_16090 [Candidatus Acidiferrales bacterium]